MLPADSVRRLEMALNETGFEKAGCISVAA